MKNKVLISNEHYTLSELFSTKKRNIIIPDFQRDYCWGDKTHGEKEDTEIVSGFLDSLIYEFKNNENSFVLLGKIDVYEDPKNYIYLTDGQQRLTTLFLLIGMLFRDTSDQTLRACLTPISDEIQEDNDPYLQYAVRESTIFFLKDLVNEFFIKKNSIKVSDIQKQPWYFTEYDLDPSITSMLSSLKTIENKLEFEDLALDSFSDFVINKIQIQYYDVGKKEHGEERFVIINTTGKSLTVSENIKPILLGKFENSKFPSQWEERETWFWKHRKTSENISDNGVNEFLTWCFQIIEKQDTFDIIKKAKELLTGEEHGDRYLIQIHKHFNSLNRIIEYLEDDKFQAQFKFINDDKEVKGILGLRGLSKIQSNKSEFQHQQQNILLPLISFISKFGNNKDISYQFLRRLRKNYFDLKWKERSNNYTDWRYILQIIERSDTFEEIVEYDNSKLEQIRKIALPKSTWFNEEDKLKNKLVEHNILLEDWEDHYEFMGDLNALFKVSDKSEDIIILETFYKTYQKLDFTKFEYSNDLKLKNLYRLVIYLENYNPEHRSVSGYGYCMLVPSQKHLFYHKDFEFIWKAANNSQNQVYEYLMAKLKEIFKEIILKENSLESIVNNSRLIGHYERVKLWAILEYLFADTEIRFENAIAQFWEYPNLVKIVRDEKSDENNYTLGNLLLGTSYYNNKSGDFKYNEYPLMKKLFKARGDFSLVEIKAQSNLYYEKLKTLIE